MRREGNEFILCAAIRRIEPRNCTKPYHEGTNDILNIELGYRHHDILQRFQGEVSRKCEDQGFYTSRGRFVDRYEGMEVAYNAGQVSKKVALSKDWYNCPITMIDTFGNEILPSEIASTDNHKFNQLFSEDLY